MGQEIIEAPFILGDSLDFEDEGFAGLVLFVDLGNEDRLHPVPEPGIQEVHGLHVKVGVHVAFCEFGEDIGAEHVGLGGKGTGIEGVPGFVHDEGAGLHIVHVLYCMDAGMREFKEVVAVDGDSLKEIPIGYGCHKGCFACGVFADYSKPPCSASAWHRFTC